MQKCPISTRVTFAADGTWRFKMPNLWLRDGKVNHFCERRNKRGSNELLEIVSEAKTGRQISERVLLGPLTKEWQLDTLEEIGATADWQRAILIEAEQLRCKARTRDQQEIVGNIGRYLALGGKRFHTEAEHQLSSMAKDGVLTLGQLHRALGTPVSHRTMQRWMKSEGLPVIPAAKGKHYRVRIGPGLYWWFAKQIAMRKAKHDCESDPPHKNVKKLTARNVKRHADQEINFRKKDIQDLCRTAAMEMKLGTNFDKITEKSHPLLSLTLDKLPTRLFKAVGRGPELEVMQIMGDLVARREDTSPQAVADALNVSLSTFKRKYLKYYKKCLALLADQKLHEKDERAKTLRNKDILQEDRGNKADQA